MVYSSVYVTLLVVMNVKMSLFGQHFLYLRVESAQVILGVVPRVDRSSQALALGGFQTLLQILEVDRLTSLAKVIWVFFALLLQSEDHLSSVDPFDITSVLQSTINHVSLQLR